MLYDCPNRGLLSSYSRAQLRGISAFLQGLTGEELILSKPTNPFVAALEQLGPHDQQGARHVGAVNVPARDAMG